MEKTNEAQTNPAPETDAHDNHNEDNLDPRKIPA